MHPNGGFRPETGGLLDAIDRIGFAHICVASAEGPMLLHAPVTLHGDRLRFHVARGNRVTRHLDGGAVALSLVETHGYISPNWYERPGDQVPTWNYVTIEVEGTAHAIGDAALVEQLDRLAELHEPADDPWHRAKMDPAVFIKMLTAIRGFEVIVTAVHGTTKLSQNKSAGDVSGIVAGLRRMGNDDLADRMTPLHTPPAA